ncbi:hypothetical protein N7495_001522 [Penicillium taxi]|uniref:uncharacterized protein n=1 Tax=Penicillium taxi TaxID=168475 RepID=UPI00254583D2|nr:uncharacterized protein N7495_001522 [Penicillium taxi]KAJ5908840.1 hypothetical protein N7495_001522 [Penicillium taxi]
MAAMTRWFNNLARFPLAKTGLLLFCTLFFLLSFGDATPIDLGFENSQLEARTTSGWQNIFLKGRNLRCAMDYDENIAAGCFPEDNVPPIRSAWTSYGDLKTWGWAKTNNGPESSYFAELDDSVKILQGLGVQPQNLEYIEWRHDKDVVVGGVEYGKTGGYYHEFYDAADGVILADNNRSPEQVKSDCPVEHMTKLRKWSDVVFLQWQRLCQQRKASVKNLKYIVRSFITNTTTKTIMRQVLGEAQDFNDWKKYKKGISFDRSNQYFNGLLGTPNVASSAWLLINHKPQLGKKRISEITIRGSFRPKSKENSKAEWVPVMILKIEDV